MENQLRNKTYQSRRERFLKTKERRIEQLKKSLNGLKKLSVKSNHAYVDEDIKEITSFLTKEIYEVIHQFSTTADNRLKYYIQAEKEHYRFLQENDAELFNLIKNQASHIEDILNQNETDKGIKGLESNLEQIKQTVLQNLDSINQLKGLFEKQNHNEK